MSVSTRSRQELVAQACTQWVRRLYDTSRRNNLLFYRELKVGTLELTGAPSTALDALVAGESVPLNKLLPQVDASVAAKVREIRRRAVANLEEKGLETLFLGLGMAGWPAADGGSPYQAVALLLPVTVAQRGREGQNFVLTRNGELQANLVLLHVLETDYGIRLDPEALLADADGDERTFDAVDIYARLAEAAKGIKDFAVTPRIVLGNFAFQKMAMVKDLRDHQQALVENNLIAAIAGDDGAREALRAARAAIDPRMLDTIPPHEEFLAFDADSSQQRVIAAVLAGQSGVIQGPPGTGKSQTIGNLMAALVANGKRVLFVAEKRAALEVVLQRLEVAGLGHLALDLHGADLTRQVVMRRLSETLQRIRDAVGVPDDEVHIRFTDRRKRLNEHVNRLHNPRRPANLSVYALQGRLLRLPPETASATRWRDPDLSRLDAPAAAAMKDLLTEAGGFASLFLRDDPSPWTQADLPDGAAAQAAMDLARQVALDGWPAVREALEELARAGELRLPATVQAAQELLALLGEVNATAGRYTDALFTQDLDALAAALAPAGKGVFAALFASLFNGAYRNARATLQSLRQAGAAAPAVLLAEATAAAGQRRRWQAHSTTAPRALPAAGAAQQRFADLHAGVSRLATLLGGSDPGRYQLAELAAFLQALANDTITPHRIPRLREIERTLAQHGVDPLVKEIRAHRPDPRHWPTLFEHAWYASCLDQARAADPALGGFSGQVHANFVEEFCALDRQRLQLASARVRRAHAEHAIAAMNANPGQEALIRRETEKKTRHLPLRRLLAEAPDVLTALCPCWMASPLSVSQLLGDGQRYFDVVIFDEASQVLPEDAVATLLRGTQAVVAGDKHQLPPTVFFMAGEADVEDENAGASEGFESFLDLMAAFLDPWPLDWHYRSKDEALIAFSNQHIYDSRLVTFPGIGISAALAHVLVEQQAGAEGQEDSSAAEVQRVVELVLEHARTRPQETLGVIALGIKHADRIELALEKALQEHPELDPFFDQSREERFFVKNLERVQGDERDAILLSVGYGKDKTGKLPYRFGPLLTAGGERRLNVAITRARRRLTLVSSFTHHDMDPKRSTARGVELLRLYLQYAAGSGARREERNAGASFPDTSLEADVFQALTERGIPLVTQWGASRYRIDFVARHPQRPERFVLALECDGAGYSSAPTARDRDRLRQQHLQSLGWRYHRIWSIDWFLRREEEIARAVAAYQDAVAYADKLDSGAADPASETAPAAAPSEAAAPAQRGPKPSLPRGGSLDDYKPWHLTALLDWLQSDGCLRSDEQLIEQLFRELGLSRRTARVEARLRSAIEEWRYQHEQGGAR